MRQEESQGEHIVSEALNWLEVQEVQEFGVGELGLTFPATQVIQFEDSGPEQVAQSAWQLEQVETVALCSFEAQLVQAPAEGWDARILRESEQERQSEEVPPEQVVQSPWQFVQVLTSALN